MQRVGAEQFALPVVRHGTAVDCDDIVREARDIAAGHHRQFAKRERVVRRAELPRAFALLEIKPVLHVVKTARAAAVVAGEQAAGGIEFQPENVAAALGENLELAGVGVITPDHAALEVLTGRAGWVDAGACDAATHRAALCAVQPAVRPPRDAVGHGVRVLKTKPGEVHFRVAVRDVIAVFVRVKQQVRCVHHPCTVVSRQGGVGEAEFVDEHFVGVVGAIAIGVLVDGDAAAAGCVVRGRLGLAVVFGAVILVATDLAQAGRVGVLDVVRYPEPSACIKAQVRRLRDERLVQHGFDDESLSQFKFLQALGWAEPFPVDEFLCLEQHAAGFMKLVVRCAAWLGRERLAKCRLGVPPVLPLARKKALEEVALNRWATAAEAACAVPIENLDRQLVPFALGQAAGWHLVALGQAVARCSIRREGAGATEAFAVEVRLVGRVA